MRIKYIAINALQKEKFCNAFLRDVMMHRMLIILRKIYPFTEPAVTPLTIYRERKM